MPYELPLLGPDGKLPESVIPDRLTIEQLALLLGGASAVGYVPVVTGAEPRPPAALVIWVGGSSRPGNCLDSDLWASETEQTVDPPVESDSTAPSVPSGVVISEQATNSFRVSWEASTDAVGVTGYEVQTNGVPQTVTGTTLVLTGRTPSTSYAVRVRARDAAGNWSDPSSTVTAVTLPAAAGTAVRHSVFPDAPTQAFAKFSDGGTLRVANAFYTYQSTTLGWKAVGMRIFLPASQSVPTPVSCFLYESPAPGLPVPDLSAPSQTAQMVALAPGQWNEVLFPEPFVMTAGSPVYVGYETTDGSYMFAVVGIDFIPAADGSPLVQSEETGVFNGVAYKSSCYSINGSPSAAADAAANYGIDIIVEED